MDILSVQVKENGVFLKLCRPAKRNALHPNLIQKLYDFFNTPPSKEIGKAVILSGEGKAFCSGADLKWLTDESMFTYKELEKLFLLLEAMTNYPLPIISVAHGFVVGGGLGLLCASDIVIAEQDTRFQFSEVQLGLIPSVISPFVLRKIGFSQAQAFILSALPFSASEALRIGLAHFIGSEKECEKFLNQVLSQINKADNMAFI